MFKQLIKDYFTFSHSERSGIILLIVFIIALLIFQISYPYLVQKSDAEMKVFDHEVDKWLGAVNELKSDTSHSNYTENNKKNRLSLFRFNPNSISADEIKELDINENAKSAWIKYLQKGGKFYRKDDLKKIYGLDSITFHRLEPYIDFIAEKPQNNTNINNYPNSKIHLIEINKASQADFEKLAGIGPVFAQRIIKYRNLLGGFIKVDQLCEVYGVNDSIIHANRSRLFLDSSLVKKISVNQADFTTLSKHPYISKYEARAIISYRELHGKLISINDLIINNLINDSSLNKVSAYLLFNY